MSPFAANGWSRLEVRSSIRSPMIRVTTQPSRLSHHEDGWVAVRLSEQGRGQEIRYSIDNRVFSYVGGQEIRYIHRLACF